ncbi:MAG: hypothetical protein HFE63_06545 [Clostridiales bacterium]|nr:hypothetical protein [Clostridiales bacterium]
MKHKQIMAAMCCAALLMSVSVSANADNGIQPLSQETKFSEYSVDREPLKDVEYISFDEYLEKYGVENVIRGFNEAEAENMRTVLRIGSEDTASLLAKSNEIEKSNEPNDLFESLSNGTFLGMEVLGITDVEPNDSRLMISLKNNALPPKPTLNFVEPVAMNGVYASTMPIGTASTMANVIVRHGADFTAYYTNSYYDTDNNSFACEPLAGSYMYKSGIEYASDYACNTNLVFNNTQLGCGTQTNIAYIFLAVNSDTNFLELGLMACPNAPERNQGLYAYTSTDATGENQFAVDPLPKVAASSFSKGKMTIDNKTIYVGISVGDGVVELYMGIDGACVFYDYRSISGLVSGVGKTLAFMEAISYVALGADGNGIETDLSSGSYIRNVKFDNPTLISYTLGSRPFMVYNDTSTRFQVLYKPSAISFDYTETSEVFSIDYNN